MIHRTKELEQNLKEVGLSLDKIVKESKIPLFLTERDIRYLIAQVHEEKKQFFFSAYSFTMGLYLIGDCSSLIVNMINTSEKINSSEMLYLPVFIVSSLTMAIGGFYGFYKSIDHQIKANKNYSLAGNKNELPIVKELQALERERLMSPYRNVSGGP